MVHGCGTCEDLARRWEVAGSVVDATTGEPIGEAEVDMTIVFSIEGVGNQVINGLVTGADGTYATTAEFTASCRPVLFGFFGSEAGNTSREPYWVDVSVRAGETEQFSEFSTSRETGRVTALERLSDGSVRGRIELPPIELEVPP